MSKFRVVGSKGDLEEITTTQKPICANCEGCVIFNQEYFCGKSGQSLQIGINPITGLETYIMMSKDNENEPDFYCRVEDGGDLPLRRCYELNFFGDCDVFYPGESMNYEDLNTVDAWSKFREENGSFLGYKLSKKIK